MIILYKKGRQIMEKVFKEILDHDEQIIKVFKPNKKRFIKIRLIFSIAWLVVAAALFLVPALLALSGVLPMVDDYGVDGSLEFGIVFLIFGLFFVFGIVFFIITVVVSYKKTYYAYSNKRIIIRQGFIGVDYATLEMKMISTVLVNVGFFDKIVKPNTGTIRFGSSATPIGITNGKGGAGFAFLYIDDAYQTYREIKEVINTHRESETTIV